MRVAVTGVAGSIGQRVIALLESDSRVDSVVGLDVSEPARTSGKLEFHLCDVVTSDLKSALRDVDVVIQISSSVMAPVFADHGATRDGATTGTRRLLEAVASSNVRRVVRAASATVYGAWDNNAVPLGEDTPLRPNSGYARGAIDAECERILFDWADENLDATAVVLRVAPVVGAATSEVLDASVTTSSRRNAYGNDRLVQVVHIDDVASAISFAATNEIAGVYNVAANGYLTAPDASGVAGKRARGLHLTKFVRGRGRSTSPATAAPYSTYSWVIANDRIRAAGWAPQFSNEEALLLSSEPDPQASKLPWIAALVAGIVSMTWWLRRRRR